MLKKRVLTALVLAPLMVWGLFYLSLGHYAVFTSLIVGLGSWEWAGLAGMKSIPQRAAYTASLLISLPVLYWLHELIPFLNVLILGAAALWWVLAFFWVRSFPASTPAWNTPKRLKWMGAVILVPMWVGLYQLKAFEHGNLWLLLLLLMIWGADVGAYFAGRKFGAHKLAPNVSPGKTWEGVAGGLALVYLVVMVAGLLASGSPGFSWSDWSSVLWMATGVVLISVVGDLVESMIKRNCGVKDSSNLLPGHGGVMDRADSMCAAVPVFALMLMAFPVVM